MVEQVEPVVPEVGLEVADRLDVGLHTLGLAVGDEDHAVDPLEDQLAAGVVEDLARHGVEVEAGGEAADRAEVEREEVEEQGAVGLGGQRDHLALRVGRGLVVDVLQVRRLAAQAGPVIDDLAVDLLAGVVDERHGDSRRTPSARPRGSGAPARVELRLAHPRPGEDCLCLPPLTPPTPLSLAGERDPNGAADLPSICSLKSVASTRRRARRCLPR